MNTITLTKLQKKHDDGEPITALTAYDASFAKIIDDAEIDIVLVGDSLGMVIQGFDSTVPVTMDDMVYHAQAVDSSLSYSLLMVDMPFMSTINEKMALENAKILMQEGGAAMVKMEGGDNQEQIIKTLTSRGVPVCAHLGLKPQLVNKYGGYKIQGKNKDEAYRILQSADNMQKAGADILLVECIPADLAKKITTNSSIPVIGIGAGTDTSGQILVLYDILGLSSKIPMFAKNYLINGASIQDAIKNYKKDVENKIFP
ncbi:MAG: 3-methyl-2-oxobutanoate hydroxymethyltransferase [Gammaproteobacteria bacterium]|nr:MAG: 3-methyl-2-oxobutanoate hydroxymethyltransferase [Gammaproteobacteria bacterium]